VRVLGSRCKRATSPPFFSLSFDPCVILERSEESTGTHAFIVIKDGKLIDERYLNGYQRDSICISRSMAKSFTSALVGIAIDEGYIKSVDDLISKYLPELHDRGFDAIAIRNLLTMGSGIRYRINALPWDEDALYYFCPNIRILLLTDMEVAELSGQSFHYTDYNAGPERSPSVGDLSAMGERGRLLQIFLVGQFQRTRRLQLRSHRQMGPVNFRGSQSQRGHSANRGQSRPRPRTVAASLLVHRKFRERQRSFKCREANVHKLTRSPNCHN
jgi:Beta-lactamase